MEIFRSLTVGGLLAFTVAGISCDRGVTASVSKQGTTEAEQPTLQTKQPKPLLQLTERAEKEVKEIIKEQNIDGDWALRLTATWPNGICSPQHKLDIDHSPPTAADIQLQAGGVRIIVLKRQTEMFREAEIDFGEKDGQVGFLVNNPNFEGELLKKWGPVLAADPLSSSK